MNSARKKMYGIMMRLNKSQDKSTAKQINNEKKKKQANERNPQAITSNSLFVAATLILFFVS